MWFGSDMPGNLIKEVPSLLAVHVRKFTVGRKQIDTELVNKQKMLICGVSQYVAYANFSHLLVHMH